MNEFINVEPESEAEAVHWRKVGKDSWNVAISVR